MDDSVIAALAKWPDVPACYDWLVLDARGQWRLGAPDSEHREIVRHAGLADFLGRNYSCTENGEWFCQNGPQRAYVSLASTPWVLRLAHDELTTHTGLAVAAIQAAYVDECGRLYLVCEHGLGIIDDRDLPAVMTHLIRCDNRDACDEAQLDALGEGKPDGIAFHWLGQVIDIHPALSPSLETRFGFIRNPTPTT